MRRMLIVIVMLCVVCSVTTGCRKAKELKGQQQQQARVTTTKANLKLLHNAVNMFKMDTGRYPGEEEGLAALVHKPSDVEGWPAGGYLDTPEIPKDGWGNDFIYQLYPESGRPFVIISLGADGRQGGEGFDADLSD